jgi:hypothetical protein
MPRDMCFLFIVLTVSLSHQIPIAKQSTSNWFDWFLDWFDRISRYDLNRVTLFSLSLDHSLLQ